jgi:dCTP diphosphatase
LASEVGELLDHFRFKSDVQVQALLDDPSAHREVAHELADCLWALLRLASVCRVDLASMLREKVDLAAIKYPVDRSFGRNDKYTAYRESGDPPAG